MFLEKGLVVEVKKPNSPNITGKIREVRKMSGYILLVGDNRQYPTRDIVRVFKKKENPEEYI